MLVDTITNGSAGDFDFTSIPSGYNRLVLKGYIRSTETGSTTDNAYLFFNGDFTPGNYHNQRISATDGSAVASAEASDPTVVRPAAASSPSGAYSSIRIVIEGYEDTSIIKGARGETGGMNVSTTGVGVGMASMTHKTLTAAITRLTLRQDQHATFGLLGTLRLYAEN